MKKTVVLQIDGVSRLVEIEENSLRELMRRIKEGEILTWADFYKSGVEYGQAS